MKALLLLQPYCIDTVTEPVQQSFARLNKH